MHTAILSYEYGNWIETESVPAWLRDSDPEDQMALHGPIAGAVARRDAKAAEEAVLKHHAVMLAHLEGVPPPELKRAR